MASKERDSIKEAAMRDSIKRVKSLQDKAREQVKYIESKYDMKNWERHEELNNIADKLNKDEIIDSAIGDSEIHNRYMIARGLNRSITCWWDRLELVFAITLVILVVLLNISQAMMAGGLTWFILLVPFSVMFLVTIIRGH